MDRYFFIKCPLFDRVQIDAPASAIKSNSFTRGSKTSIKDGLKAVRESPFKTVFVIDEENKKSIFAITQNIPFVNESRKKGGGGGGGLPPLPPDPISECCNTCIGLGASGCLLLENMQCWCLYDDGGGAGPRDIDTNDELGSLPR